MRYLLWGVFWSLCFQAAAAQTPLSEGVASLGERPISEQYDTPSDHYPNFVFRLDTDFYRAMLDFQNRQTDKHLLILENNALWAGYPAVTVGGQARLSAFAAVTNTAGKFSYLGRFPPDFEDKVATDARILQANAGMTAHVNNWINLHGELLFSDVFTFPDFKQGSLQVRQAYAVLGDLNQTPWYAVIGKKNVAFGDMGTLAPFTQSVVWHYFGALHEGLSVGYARDGFDFSVTGLNGGRGIRVADSVGRGKINNFAANVSWRGESEAAQWRFGGGFLLGTIYDVTVAEHLDANAFGPYNSAWDAYGELRVGNWTLAGEIAATVDDWPTTGSPVIAYRAEAAYDASFQNRPARYSVSWSEGIQGPDGSEFEFNRQLVAGVGIDLGPYAMLSLEYVRSMGFAPLINITTVSDRNAAQDTAVAGLTIAF